MLIPSKQQSEEIQVQSQFQSSTVFATPTLTRLAQIRKQMEQLKLEADAIEFDAIAEAFSVMESGIAANGKNVVFSDKNAKIVVAFKTKYDVTIPAIERLDADIDREYQKLCQQNSEELAKIRAYIEELEALIEEAETKQSGILTSPYLEKLKKQRAIALEETKHQVASLSVYVK